MNVSRTGVVGVVILLAVVLQVAVFNLFSVNGVVPNLALVVVVAAASPGARSSAPSSGSSRDCCSTSLLRPTTWPGGGRWRSCSIAILAGRVRADARRSPLAGLATVAICSFVATSVFALSGVVWVTTPCPPAR